MLLFRKRFSFFLLFFPLNCAYFNLFYNARSYFKKGESILETNPTQARENFIKAKEKSLLMIKKYPKSRYAPEALFLASLCHYHLSEYEKAKERLQLFVSLYPRHKLSSRAKFYQALAYLKGGDFSEGIFLLRNLAEEDKKEERKIKFTILSYLLEKGELSLVKESLKVFIATYPKTKEGKAAKLLLAQALFQLADYRESKRYYEEYLQEISDKRKKGEILLKIGECLLNYETQQESLKNFLNRLTAISTLYPELKNKINLLKGKILLSLPEERSALALLSEVRGGVEGAESYFIIGEYYEKNGDFNRALIYYDTAISFSRSSEFGYLAEKKKKLIEKFAQEDTLNPASRDFARAELYLLSLEKPDWALREYEKVFTLYPEDSLAPKSLYAYAWIKKFLLKEPEGDSLFLTLIRRYPQTEYAKESKNILSGK
ncbi:MAG: tetratricopeptide repeat protein [candidate division WOR-3 bacterium]